MSNGMALTLTLSHPMGEGTAIARFDFGECAFRQLRLKASREPEDDSPSPIGWERAGVRVFVPHVSLVTRHF